MHRHPSLAKRVAQNLTSTRASVTEGDLRRWFSQVEDNLKKKGLISIGSKQIFNLDESAFMMVPKDNTVLTTRGAKAVYQIVSASEKACITTLITASAAGEMAPPMIMFDRKTTPKKTILDKIPKGWGVGHTESGWMTAESFYNYIKNVFFKWLVEKDHPFPVILYVDGHSSHCTLPLVKFCKENQIELISLYPNATHIIQPLDVALFRPLKESYAKEHRRYKIENDVVNFKKWMFASVLKLALDAVDFSKTIQSGFRACGLYPFNPDAVDYNILNKSIKKKSIPKTCESNNCENIGEMNSNIQRQRDLLQVFESQVIPSSSLELFKKHEWEASWTGDITQKALFEAWKKLSQVCAVNGREECAQESCNIEELNEADDNNLIYIDDYATLENNVVTQQLHKHLNVDPQQVIVVEHNLHDDLDQNSSLVYDIITDPKLSIEIMQETEQNIVFFPNESSSELLQKNNVEIESSTNSIDMILDDNALHYFPIHGNSNFNTSSLKPPPPFSNCSDTAIISRINPKILTDIQNTSDGCEALDLSCHSETSDQHKSLCTDNEKNTPATSKETSNISAEKSLSDFDKSFHRPDFNVNKKKKRKRSDENIPIACTVDDMLEVLEKKDSVKKLKEKEVIEKRQNRTKNKIIKQKEQIVKTILNETKKKMLQYKKNLSAEIKNLKKAVKVNNDLSSKNKLQSLELQLNDLEKSIKHHELTALEQTHKIKQDIV